MSYKAFLSSKLAIASLIILMAILGNLKIRQWMEQSSIEKEKQKLVAQNDSLQKKNDELNQSLDYFNSYSFRERVARQQLNLKKNGETVYNFTDNQNLNASPTLAAQGGNKSNVQKWFDYFTQSP